MELAFDNIEKLAELYKLFGDTTRLKILISLSTEPKSVNEIVQELGISQSAISHQLKHLKNARLVKNQRDGQAIYYSLSDIPAYSIIHQGLKHIEEKRGCYEMTSS